MFFNKRPKTPDSELADSIRRAVSELNSAVAAAESAGLKVCLEASYKSGIKHVVSGTRLEASIYRNTSEEF